MILDVTDIPLTPGDGGANCLGNGAHRDTNGQTIECCCEECDYALCCVEGACDACQFEGTCPKTL